VQRLCDVVSKNGNLLLSVPQRGDGSIDEDEVAILEALAGWFAVNGEAIHATRPWRMFGEGPTRLEAGAMNEGRASPFTSADIRFTTKGDALHALFLDWPERRATIEALGTRALPQARIERVELLGGGPLEFEREEAGLRVTLPPPRDAAFVPALRIFGSRLI
jgi:alpha-L-fucosidase